MALPMRLIKICPMRSASPIIVVRFGGASKSRDIAFSSACGRSSSIRRCATESICTCSCFISIRPASIRDMSSRSLMSAASRFDCRCARLKLSCCFWLISPVFPSSMSEMNPMIDVRGVRNSCDTSETNSDFICSISCSFVMSSKT